MCPTPTSNPRKMIILDHMASRWTWGEPGASPHQRIQAKSKQKSPVSKLLARAGKRRVNGWCVVPEWTTPPRELRKKYFWHPRPRHGPPASSRLPEPGEAQHSRRLERNKTILTGPRPGPEIGHQRWRFPRAVKHIVKQPCHRRRPTVGWKSPKHGYIQVLAPASKLSVERPGMT